MTSITHTVSLGPGNRPQAYSENKCKF